MLALVRRLRPAWLNRLVTGLAYAIGSIAAWWMLERLLT
jgi:hypothetical protein